MLKIKSSEFIRSASSKKDFIHDDRQIILFAGRSNAGKSSFINSVLQRKKLAKTSQTPGKTRLINYFLINNDFYFVDLPGYGYAKVSKSERDQWRKLINDFLIHNENISLVFSIVDIRHKPTALDHEMVSFFSNYNFRQIVLLNKSDKLSNNKIANQKRIITNDFKNYRVEKYIPYSSLKHTKRDDILELLDIFLKDINLRLI